MSTVSVPIPPIPRICPPASPPLAQFSGFSPIYGMNPFLRRVCVSGCVFSAEKRGNHAHGPASRVRSLHTAFCSSPGAESNAFCPRVAINARSPARHAGCVAFGVSPQSVVRISPLLPWTPFPPSQRRMRVDAARRRRSSIQIVGSSPRHHSSASPTDAASASELPNGRGRRPCSHLPRARTIDRPISLQEATVLPPDQRISAASVPHPPAHYDAPVIYHTDDPEAVRLSSDSPRVAAASRRPAGGGRGHEQFPAVYASVVLGSGRGAFDDANGAVGRRQRAGDRNGHRADPLRKRRMSLCFPLPQPLPRADRRRGIPRCSECRGYLNPFCSLCDGNRAFLCNLCGTKTPLPDWFPAEADPVELRSGSYEAVVDPAMFRMSPRVGSIPAVHAESGGGVRAGPVGAGNNRGSAALRGGGDPRESCGTGATAQRHACGRYDGGRAIPLFVSPRGSCL